MVLRSILGIILIACLPAMAEENLHLERCSGQQLGIQTQITKWQSVGQDDVTSPEVRIGLRKDILAAKLDCVYHILGEQIGGENTAVFEAVKTGKFKSGIEAMKQARLDLLRSIHFDQIVNDCGRNMKDPLGNKCVLAHSDFTVVDDLATANAIHELVLPTMLSIPTADLTLAQQREAHVGLVKMNLKR